ncbi:Nuclease-related domain protein [Shewanella sp. P1-14-1]|uniref:nuclease-related domain-containing protein n=1 Tax=Shewanella sp. P1-14-1 TaxID=1723761 RepID=UPI0006D65B8E|nr:nuclease-related domain-containing protein [Shewanella sp. P1-14-1]KPZ73204.1 Nuclease-related domain protein [Shewanella sp. P1-14-1]
MILKTKTLQNTVSPQAIAGQKQEQNVAFFLRRAFKDNPEILVINDFKFTFNDETAQIDHLIVYPYGFVLIESKSIKGHVNVNKQGEWTRSFNQQWSGIASPIKQVELQQILLKELLAHHKSEILGKLLGIKQQGFNLRCWDHLCVISSDAIIDRNAMPKVISEQLVKSEFLVDKLKEIMNLTNKFMRFINVKDTRPDFNQAELDSIGHFILSQHIDSSNQASEVVAKTPEKNQQPQVPTAVNNTTPITNNQPTSATKLSCKHCGESTNYTPMYGKFGYYINCNQCTKNTPMKQACPQCQSKNTRVQKRKETYTLNCQDCSHSQQIV